MSAPARILIADDERELRSLLQRYLGEHGLQVRAVADAASAEKLLARNAPRTNTSSTLTNAVSSTRTNLTTSPRTNETAFASRGISRRIAAERSTACRSVIDSPAADSAKMSEVANSFPHSISTIVDESRYYYCSRVNVKHE